MAIEPLQKISALIHLIPDTIVSALNAATTKVFSGTWTFSSPLRVANAVNNDEAVNLGQLNASRAGLDVKAAVRVAQTVALPSYSNSSGVLTASINGALDTLTYFDNVSLAVNDLVLVWLETAGNAPHNGMYVVTSLGSAGTPWVLTRFSDANENVEVTSGVSTLATAGTLYKKHTFALTTPDPIVLGTTALNFEVIFGTHNIVAGQALTKDDSTDTLNVNVDNATLEIVSDQLRLKATWYEARIYSATGGETELAKPGGAPNIPDNACTCLFIDGREVFRDAGSNGQFAVAGDGSKVTFLALAAGQSVHLKYFA